MLISQRGNCTPTSDILKCMCTHIKMGVLFRGYGVQHSNSNTVQGDFNVSLSSCRSVYFTQSSRLVHNLKCFGFKKKKKKKKKKDLLFSHMF